MLVEWWSQEQANVTALIHAYNAGGVTEDEFFDEFKRNILDFEIRKNNANQHTTGQRNRARKEQSQSDANFFTSTIHSVKGLEFDNVVLVHRPVDTADEESKRLYYVALTRAKNTEFIIAVAKATMPKLVTDYRTMVASLEQAEKEAADLEADDIISDHAVDGVAADDTDGAVTHTADDSNNEAATDGAADNNSTGDSAADDA